MNDARGMCTVDSRISLILLKSLEKLGTRDLRKVIAKSFATAASTPESEKQCSMVELIRDIFTDLAMRRNHCKVSRGLSAIV